MKIEEDLVQQELNNRLSLIRELFLLPLDKKIILCYNMSKEVRYMNIMSIDASTKSCGVAIY